MIDSLKLIDGLPFIELKVIYMNNELRLQNVLVDTGSAGTILNADLVRKIGIKPEPDDTIETIRGVGGKEFVYLKKVDLLEIGDLKITNFVVEIGDMDYGLDIDGILGMDFLLKMKSVINLDLQKITFNH